MRKAAETNGLGLNRFPLLSNTPLIIETHWSQSSRSHPCPVNGFRGDSEFESESDSESECGREWVCVCVSTQALSEPACVKRPHDPFFLSLC